MDFQLADVLKSVGTTASLVFASWIFMGFLQQRYTAAYERFRSLVSEHRQFAHDSERQRNVGEQILLYRQRCAWMRQATNIGMVSAILLLLALVSGVLDVVLPKQPLLKYAGTLGTVLGLVLMMVAAALVILENSAIRKVLDSEMLDIPDLAASAGLRAAGKDAQEARRP